MLALSCITQYILCNVPGALVREMMSDKLRDSETSSTSQLYIMHLKLEFPCKHTILIRLKQTKQLEQPDHGESYYSLVRCSYDSPLLSLPQP